jgi:hypothetical protein
MLGELAVKTSPQFCKAMPQESDEWIGMDAGV